MDSSCHYISSTPTSISFCCGCQTWETKLWSEACKGQGGLGRRKGDPRDPCIICYKIVSRSSYTINKTNAHVWCANQEGYKAFRIYNGKEFKADEGRVYCMKQGARWTKMGILRKGQKWPKNNKFLEKIAQCPPYLPPVYQ